MFAITVTDESIHATISIAKLNYVRWREGKTRDKSEKPIKKLPATCYLAPDESPSVWKFSFALEEIAAFTSKRYNSNFATQILCI